MFFIENYIGLTNFAICFFYHQNLEIKFDLLNHTSLCWKHTLILLFLHFYRGLTMLLFKLSFVLLTVSVLNTNCFSIPEVGLHPQDLNGKNIYTIYEIQTQKRNYRFVIDTKMATLLHFNFLATTRKRFEPRMSTVHTGRTGTLKIRFITPILWF